ncbi:MAG: hypothetical protein K2N00_00405, partial [Lachnospiraceae bacterium]|nr:hypothetical protein [Lachnospiraceae bacterium]
RISVSDKYDLHVQPPSVFLNFSFLILYVMLYNGHRLSSLCRKNYCVILVGIAKDYSFCVYHILAAKEKQATAKRKVWFYYVWKKQAE